MRLFYITSCFLFFTAVTGYAQISGNIKNYAHQPLYLYQCYADTLLFVDSTHTNKKGEFVFSIPQSFNHINHSSDNVAGFGMYKVVLQRNQFFFLLYDGNPIKISAVYIHDIFYNWAGDSLEVISPSPSGRDGVGLSDENKLFYEFQRVQKKVMVANFVMREILRLFPYYDSYRNEMEKEYEHRYDDMEQLLQKALKEYPAHLSAKIIKAYYTPNPDWKQPDNWRDSIIAAHYFDYFNPADSFYLHTNILPEKINNYFDLFSFLLRVNRETSSDYEKHIIKAADDFLKHTVSNAAVHEFCLQYILKKSDSEKMFDALFSVYDRWVYQAKAGDCEQTNPALNKWREKVSVLRNIQIGSIAPDFELMEGKLNLYGLPSDYTLLLFWATWCPHCVEEVPKIRDAVNDFNSKHSPSLPPEGKGRGGLMVVAVSLDTVQEQWQKFVTEKNLLSFINFSELKGWKSEVVKKYNVYATPTLFLLDKDKKIIAKPETAEQLSNLLK